MRQQKKPSKKLKPKSKPKLLLPQMERAAEVEQSPDPQQESGGLLANLKSLFASPSSESPSSNQSQSPKASSPDSSESISPESETISKPLAADVEAALSSVPDVVTVEAEPQFVTAEEGAELDEMPAEDAAAALNNRAKVDALLALGYFDAEDGADLADELFDFLAVKFESDHWKLDTKRRAKIGRFAAACLNGGLQRLFDLLPDGTGAAVVAHPEYVGLASSVGGAALPRAIKQIKVSRTKKKRGAVVKAADGSAAAAPAAEPLTVKASSAFGIPVASGSIK